MQKYIHMLHNKSTYNKYLKAKKMPNYDKNKQKTCKKCFWSEVLAKSNGKWYGILRKDEEIGVYENI